MYDSEIHKAVVYTRVSQYEIATHSSVRLGSGTVCFQRGSSFDNSRLNPTAGDPRATSAIWNLCSSAAGLALTALRHDPSVEHSISTEPRQRFSAGGRLQSDRPLVVESGS